MHRNNAALSVCHSLWQALAALLAVSALLLRSAGGEALSGSPNPAAASSGAAQAPPAIPGSGASAQGQAAAQPGSAASVPALYSYKVGSARASAGNPHCRAAEGVCESSPGTLVCPVQQRLSPSQDLATFHSSKWAAVPSWCLALQNQAAHRDVVCCTLSRCKVR